jgi:hypothetical protein
MGFKPQGNNILAGTSLAIAQIQSPDYVAGVSGWCIFQNGNAEFNSGTFRGYIISGSLFLYNGTPGVGTLVASITTLATDPFGNTTYPGFTSYGAGGVVTQLDNAILNMGLPPTATTSPATIDSPDGVSIVISSGLASALDTAAALSLQSASAAGASYPFGAIFPTAPLIFDTWHVMGAFATHYSHGSPAPAYQFNADNTVSFAGEVNVTSGAAGATFYTLTADAYFPQTVKKFAVPFSAGTPAAAACAQVTVDTSGGITLSAPPAGSAFSFSLDGIRYPLGY